MRTHIIPAILSDSPHEALSLLESIKEVANEIQLDILDNSFLPGVTVQAKDFSKKQFSGISLEVHLMVSRPGDFIEPWHALGASRIIVHVELHPKAHLLQHIRSLRMTPAVCINIDTPLSSLDPYLHLIDNVQFMGIVTGAQGRPFQHHVLERIAQFHVKYPLCDIAIDGGISEDNIQSVAQAGASRIVVGSMLFKGTKSPQEELTRLQALI